MLHCQMDRIMIRRTKDEGYEQQDWPSKCFYLWEVVVTQLVERSLSIPEVCGSTPVIGKILLNICLLSAVLKRRK